MMALFPAAATRFLSSQDRLKKLIPSLNDAKTFPRFPPPHRRIGYPIFCGDACFKDPIQETLPPQPAPPRTVPRVFATFGVFRGQNRIAV